LADPQEGLSSVSNVNVKVIMEPRSMLQSCSVSGEHVSLTWRLGYWVSPKYVPNDVSTKKSFRASLPTMECRDSGHGHSILTEVT
jgi:hypothetical protein